MKLTQKLIEDLIGVARECHPDAVNTEWIRLQLESDPARGLKAIACAIEWSERENAPLVKPQPKGVKIDGWDV